MKKTTFILIFAIACATGYSQWEHSGGPEGTRLDNIEYAQGRLFADMAYYSDDNGDTWHEYSARPTDKHISSFIESGSRILITGNNTVYGSDNKGDSWTEKITGLPGDMQVPNVFTDGSTVYLVTFSGDLYSSTNDGDSWSEVTTNLDKYKIMDMVFINDTMVAYTEDPFKGDDAIHWSTDAETWTASNYPDYAVTSLEIAYNKVYAIAQNDGLYISSDNGNTFANVNSDINSGFLLENNSDLFYFSKDDGVNLLSEDGTTLTPKQNGIATNILSDLISANNILFLATGIGVYRSGNNAENWTLANEGLGYQPVNAMVNLGDTLFAGTGGGVWRSYSYGLRWVPVGLNGKVISSMVYANDAIYVVANVNNAVENVYMSDDLGETWSEVGSGLPSTQNGSVTAFKNNLIFKAFGEIYKLEGFTGTWQQIRSNSGAIWADGDYLYVGGNVLQRTSDLSSWENLSGLNNDIDHFTKDNQYYYAGGIYRSTGQRPMYRSSDGVSFSEFTTGLPQCDGGSLATRNDTTYYAVTKHKSESGSIQVYDSIYVYETYSDASGWTLFQELLPDIITCTLYGTEESLLLASAVSAKGLYRYNFQPIPEVPDTVDQIEYPPVSNADIPFEEENISLNIYPNPVSDNITIQSGQPVNAVTVFNQQGISLIRKNGGNIQSVDVSSLSPGFYFISIEQNDQISTRRIIIK